MTDHQFRRRHPVLNISVYIPLAVGAVLLLAAYFIYKPSVPTLLIVGIIVILGFGLPRWIGWTARKARAQKAMETEKAKWGFHSRDREGAWINYIDKPLVKRTDYAKGKYFYSERLIIHDGYIILNPGHSTPGKIDTEVNYHPNQRRTYAWDGCTPKLLFFWLALIGTPDWWHKREQVQFVDRKGQLDLDPDSLTILWPQAHHASLVHDGLYQYLGQIPITKRDVDQLFCEMLIDSGMWPPMAKLYRWAVHSFGAREIPPDSAADNARFSVSGFSFLPPRTPK